MLRPQTQRLRSAGHFGASSTLACSPRAPFPSLVGSANTGREYGINLSRREPSARPLGRLRARDYLAGACCRLAGFADHQECAGPHAADDPVALDLNPVCAQRALIVDQVVIRAGCRVGLAERDLPSPAPPPPSP